MNNSIQLVFATNNAHKIKEVNALLPEHIKVLSLEEIGCQEEIPETSETIEGNALQKARYVKTNYGYDCFSDDTGLEVEALNGAPGVRSARYAGEEKDDRANMEKLKEEMKGRSDQSARFKTVLALILGEKEQIFTGICQGKILNAPRGEEGFGYDPIFQPIGYSKTFAEMDLLEKSKISHRGRATRQLVDFLKEKFVDHSLK